MARAVRSRVALETAFLIAVAAGIALVSLPTAAIVAFMAAAWVLVALTERRSLRRRPPRSLAGEEAPEPGTDPEPLREPVPAVESETPPSRPLETDPDGAPPPLTEHPPAEKPQIDVEHQTEPEREASGAPIVRISAPAPRPRAWNIWDLQRALRSAGHDERHNELAYLLMYLRGFADPDGALPPTFDGLVRDSFRDLLHLETA